MSNKEIEIVNKNETVAEATEETVEIERKYTLRSLKDKDLWTVLGIITKVFPDDLASIFAKSLSGEKKHAEVGASVVLRLVLAVLHNIDKVHDELYAFLEDVSGIPAKEIEEMEFGTTPLMIWDIVGDAKNASFFKVVSKLL
jgi:hypothetical protein